MKKIISFILVVCMLVSAVCLGTSAATEDSVEKQKLDYLVMLYEYDISEWGNPCTYMMYGSEPYHNALRVLEDENSTDYDYYYAKNLLFDQVLNKYIIPEYAQKTYEMAKKEKNYNNWYTEEQWSNFQSKLADLGEAIETHQDYSKKLTIAYQAMMKAYNEMTNAYTLKGDLDKSGEVNVMDATLLMKYLVELEDLTGAQKMLSGALNYEELTVKDATTIQKYIVELIDEIPNNNVFIEDREECPVIDRDLLMERTINFNICPRVLFGPYISNDFTDFSVAYSYIAWCKQNGYEP